MNASLYLPTFPQRTLLTEYSLYPRNEALDLLFVFRLAGPLDRPRLRRALETVLGGADGVNTRFEQLGGQWIALVDPHPFTAREITLEGIDTDRAAADFAEADLAAGRIRPEDPEQVRVTLMHTAGDVSYMYLRASHLVGDAYTFYCVMAAVSAAYQMPEEQWPELSRWGHLHPGSLTPPGIPPEARAGYAQRLHGLDTYRHEALDVPREDGRVLGAHLGHVFAGAEADAVRGSWAVARYRTASTFFAAYAALLHRLNPQADVVLGVPLANRAGGPAKRAVGYFVNTLPLPVRIDRGTTWGELCDQVGRGVRLLQSVQGLDLAGEPGRDLRPASGVVIDNTVTFYKQALLLDLPGIRSTAVRLRRRALTHPLSLNVADDGSTYTLDLSAADRLLDTDPLDRLREAVLDLTPDPDRKVVSGSVFQVPDGPFTVPRRPSGGASITQALSRAGTAHPDRVALRHNGVQVTYRELWRQVLATAAALDAAGATDHVLVRIDKGIDAVVAMLAVICSGRVYVPVDPAAPVERLAAIERQVATAQRTAPTVLGGIRPPGPVPDGYQLPVLSPETIAYVIFTSGSTGEPKGVEIPHGNVLDLMHSTVGRLGLGPDDVWCLFHSLAFDFSVWEVFGPLLTGGTLVIPEPEQVRDPLAFQDLLEKERVTVLNQTPSAFRRLCAALARAGADLSAVRLVVFGGEAMYPGDLLAWREQVGPRATAVNMYGITETTVHVTLRELTPDDERSETRSVIGEPLGHLGLLVVDGFGRPVLPGRAGELLVTGTGLARGYLGRPEETQNRFRPVCHDGITERAYRTGDVVAREGTELVYVGRCDDQVQLRGHRIELGEVQAALLALPSVSACVVRLVEPEGAEPFLAAWVAGSEPSEVAVIRAALQHRLPPYMVPTRFTPVAAIPTNQNGKPDLAALEKPSPAEEIVLENPPQDDDLAHRIARIWARVIGSGPVGVNDHYLEVGGTSMHLLPIHEQISAEPEVGEFNLVDLYEYSTPQTLAGHLTALDHFRQV